MCEENEVPHSRGHFSARPWQPVLWTQIKIDHESSPSVSLRESRANETRSPAASRLNLVGDFHARSCFARFTIPEGKWGTNRSQNKEARPVTVLPSCVCRFQNKVMSLIKSWLIYDKPTWSHLLAFREWPDNGRSYGAIEASTVDGKSSELLTVDVY